MEDFGASKRPPARGKPAAARQDDEVSKREREIVTTGYESRLPLRPHGRAMTRSAGSVALHLFCLVSLSLSRARAITLTLYAPAAADDEVS